MLPSPSPTSSPTPIPILLLGRTTPLALILAHSLAPHFSVPAIVTLETYSAQAVPLLLATLQPRPVGVLVGGGLGGDVQAEVEGVVRAWNKGETMGDGEKGMGEEGKGEVKLVCIPVGIREKVGNEGVLEWVKGELGREFGVVW